MTRNGQYEVEIALRVALRREPRADLRRAGIILAELADDRETIGQWYDSKSPAAISRMVAAVYRDVRSSW